MPSPSQHAALFEAVHSHSQLLCFEMLLQAPPLSLCCSRLQVLRQLGAGRQAPNLDGLQGFSAVWLLGTQLGRRVAVQVAAHLHRQGSLQDSSASGCWALSLAEALQQARLCMESVWRCTSSAKGCVAVLTPVQLQGWLLRAFVKGMCCQWLSRKRALGCNADAFCLNHICCGALHSRLVAAENRLQAQDEPTSHTDRKARICMTSTAHRCSAMPQQQLDHLGVPCRSCQVDGPVLQVPHSILQQGPNHAIGTS